MIKFVSGFVRAFKSSILLASELLNFDSGATRNPVTVSKYLLAISSGKRMDTVRKLKMSWIVAPAYARLKFSGFEKSKLIILVPN